MTTISHFPTAAYLLPSAMPFRDCVSARSATTSTVYSQKSHSLSTYSSIPRKVAQRQSELDLTGHGGGEAYDGDKMDRWTARMDRWQNCSPISSKRRTPTWRWTRTGSSSDVAGRTGSRGRIQLCITNHGSERRCALHPYSIEGVKIEQRNERWCWQVVIARDHRAGAHAANVFDALAAHCRRRDMGRPTLGTSSRSHRLLVAACEPARRIGPTW